MARVGRRRTSVSIFFDTGRGGETRALGRVGRRRKNVGVVDFLFFPLLFLFCFFRVRCLLCASFLISFFVFWRAARMSHRFYYLAVLFVLSKKKKEGHSFVFSTKEKKRISKRSFCLLLCCQKSGWEVGSLYSCKGMRACVLSARTNKRRGARRRGQQKEVENR